ncbi:glutamate ABC transporter substrate-binding protein [Streptomyces sp. TRM64462]|uniref:glutamate ABC transporter substrate-binding protein n=1 Tax=Streptomyces sp. TRM64462 TaxID=2741726 RepID=UPI001586348A|nr:glutamate ABC transporter substrate-binding protein [Streptomyces sp. TRM64462]
MNGTNSTNSTHGANSTAGSAGTGSAVGRFRGWGGVAAMGAACALTGVLALVPLCLGGAPGGSAPGGSAPGGSAPDRQEHDRQERDGGGVVRVQPAGAAAARSETCTDPEASLRPSSADGPAVDAIKARGKLIVGVDQNSYRWGYRDPAKGTLEGFDIDLARAIAADIVGSPDAVIFRAVPTNQRIAALEGGKVDLIVRTMTINCARIEQVAFSTAYFQTGQQVLAPKDSTVTGYDASLAGKRVCSAEGSTAYEALERDAFGAKYRDEGDGTPQDADRLTVPNQLDCLVRLQTGEVDAIVTDSALAAGQAAQDPAVELKGRPFTTEYYGVAAKLGKDDLVRRVNQVLVAYRNGPWQRAYDKWLKADLPGIAGPPAPKYRTG